MPRNTHKTQKRLRGGSVPYLSSEKLGYKSPEDMKKDMDMITVGCHGETTSDQIFFIVPSKTYLMFTTHSGEPALGDDPSEASYITYKKNETIDDYYKKVYSQLFTPYSDRVATGRPQYKETLYIYEPGDIIPDYFLSFNNVSHFFFMHGIYRLPIETLSENYSFLGRTAIYIRKLLDQGKLDPSLLRYLEPQDKDTILNNTIEELYAKNLVYLKTANIRNTPLFSALEDLCCRNNPDNLLFKPPFNQEQLKENKYVIRLSEVFKLLKPKEGKTKRFFFLNFCRVIYSEYYTKFKTLARTISFSGKCSAESDRTKAFNLSAVALKFCRLSQTVKLAILNTYEGQELLRTFKMALLPVNGTQFWLNCIGELWKKIKRTEYYSFNNSTNNYKLTSYYTGYGHHLVHDYYGYLYYENLMNLAKLYPVLKKLQSKFKDTIELKNELIQFSEPFKTLYEQLKDQITKVNTEKSIRDPLIKEIYTKILDKIKPNRFSIEKDILYLSVTPMINLTLILNQLDKGGYNEELEEISKKEYDFNKDLEDDLYDEFKIYAGYAPLQSKDIPFTLEIKEDVAKNIYKTNLIEENSNSKNGNTNSISNGSENNNSNTNSNNNSNITTYTNTKNGGYKRKTRRRLVRKQKTRTTAKNT